MPTFTLSTSTDDSEEGESKTFNLSGLAKLFGSAAAIGAGAVAGKKILNVVVDFISDDDD